MFTSSRNQQSVIFITFCLLSSGRAEATFYAGQIWTEFTIRHRIEKTGPRFDPADRPAFLEWRIPWQGVKLPANSIIPTGEPLTGPYPNSAFTSYYRVPYGQELKIVPPHDGVQYTIWDVGQGAWGDPFNSYTSRTCLPIWDAYEFELSHIIEPGVAAGTAYGLASTSGSFVGAKFVASLGGGLAVIAALEASDLLYEYYEISCEAEEESKVDIIVSYWFHSQTLVSDGYDTIWGSYFWIDDEGRTVYWGQTIDYENNIVVFNDKVTAFEFEPAKHLYSVVP